MNYNIQEELLRQVKVYNIKIIHKLINSKQTSNLSSSHLKTKDKESVTQIWMSMLGVNFTLGLNFLFFSFKLIIIYYHTKNKGK